MKKLVLAVALTSALIGCSTAPKVDPLVTAVIEWRETKRPLVDAGGMRWSDYLIGLYDRYSKLQGDELAVIEMGTISGLIKDARRYEAGELTKDQFDDIRREANARSAEKRQAVINANDAETRRAALQMLQNRPVQTNQPLYIPPINRTNCTTTYIGNTAQTTCR
jgi:hypothetical protein